MSAKFLSKLQRVLTKANRCGETSIAGEAAKLPLPVVKVKGVGRITFPLPPKQAEKLAKVAQQAPFGRGLETVVDTTVRNTLQIDPDDVNINSSQKWRRGFERLIQQVASGLGTDPAFVEAKLYKLLLYQKGGHFDFHRDTEKERGMFATLVVQLPSEFSGGEFVVRHGGVEKTYTLGSDDSSCSQLSYFVAHYADCEHAVREVTEGHRLALVYSLCWKGDGAPPTSAILSSAKLSKRLANMFQEGFHANNVPVPLCVYLEHKYTEASLSKLGVRALKGRDRATAEALLAAGHVLSEVEKDKGNELSMCIASCTQVREVGCDSDNGRTDPDSDVDARDTKLKVVFETDGKINEDLQRLKVDWTSWVQSEALILSDSDPDYKNKRRRRDDKEDSDKDDKDDSGGDKDGESDDDEDDYHYSAWRSMHDRVMHRTGNEGATKETTYSSYILMVWPKKLHVSVLTQCGMDLAMSYIDGASETDAATLLSYVVKHVDSYLLEETANSCTLLLQALARFRQPQLVCDLLEVFATRHRRYSYDSSGAAGLFSSDITTAIIDAALAVGLAHVQPAIEKLLAASREHHRGSQLERRLILIEKLALDIDHKKSAMEDTLAHLESREGSICKAGLRLLASINGADLLARFQKFVLTCFQGKKKDLLRDDELAPLLVTIDNVLAEEQVEEPAHGVLHHVRREAGQLCVRRFVEAVERSDPKKIGYYWGSDWSKQGHVVRDEELGVFLRSADASMMSIFLAALQYWSLDKWRKLNDQIDQCVKETELTPEALSAVREIKAAFIDFLRKETQHKPVYSHEMSEARYPDDDYIEKFLRSPRPSIKLFMDRGGDLYDAEELKENIESECESSSCGGFSMEVSVGGTHERAFVLLKKTKEILKGKMEKHEENCRLLKELLKEQAGAVATTKACSSAASSSTLSSPGASESAEPASKRAKIDG